jgi:hypothetical protein
MKVREEEAGIWPLGIGEPAMLPPDQAWAAAPSCMAAKAEGMSLATARPEARDRGIEVRMAAPMMAAAARRRRAQRHTRAAN